MIVLFLFVICVIKEDGIHYITRSGKSTGRYRDSSEVWLLSDPGIAIKISVFTQSPYSNSRYSWFVSNNWGGLSRCGQGRR